MSSTEKQELINTLNDHREVIMNELTLLASNKLFKSAMWIQIEQDREFTFADIRTIEELYKHTRNAKMIHEMMDKTHRLIGKAIDELKYSINREHMYKK